MRKWHRWLSVIFGVLILWIATTGLMSQFAAIYADRVDPRLARPVAAGNALIPAAQAHNEVQPAPAATSAAPASATPPRRHPARELVSTLHHLHAGESFGPVGTALSILSGFALLFFAFSGLWMYIQMFRNRISFRREGDAKWFWK